MSEYTGHSKSSIMDRVMVVRYTDLEEEKELCLDLLKWAETQQDTYALAFAHVYLGDYYIAQNESEAAMIHFMKAGEFLEQVPDSIELLTRMNNLLGIYYETQADEQNSIEHYVIALRYARRLSDKTFECIILNNLAHSLQKHESFSEAYRYYEEARKLLLEFPTSDLWPTLLSNLAELALVLEKNEEARIHLDACELKQKNIGVEQDFLLNSCNWCCYYNAIGEAETALLWADKILAKKEPFSINKLGAFGNYGRLCQSMIGCENKDYAIEFLYRMRESCSDQSIEQLQYLEAQEMRYCLKFETEENRTQAYRSYYQKSVAFKKRINENITKAMQVKIRLEELAIQREALRSRREILRQEANMDELTGIYNRRYLELLMREYSDGDKEQQLGIIMLDADYFKEYNDYYGHLEGDKALKAIGMCLSENSTNGLFPCRYGGDEFICVCVGMTTEQIKNYIAAVRQCLESKNLLHEKSLCADRVTFSIGYAVKTAADEDINLILQRADQGLYQSKLRGRNTFTEI